MLSQFNSPIDPETGERIPTPWISHPNNVKNFFETGIDRVTNVSLSNGGKWGSIRLSLTNASEQGMVPNTNMTRNTVAFSGNTNLTEKLSFDAKVSYNNNKGNLNGTGYTDNNVMMQTLWGARQVDWEWEKTHYENPNRTTTAGSADGMTILTGCNIRISGPDIKKPDYCLYFP